MIMLDSVSIYFSKFLGSLKPSDIRLPDVSVLVVISGIEKPTVSPANGGLKLNCQISPPTERLAAVWKGPKPRSKECD